LARRVRTQIEALLPERLGSLAQYAGRWRNAVKAALPGLPARLRFWDGFFNGPVATSLLAGSESGADAAMQRSLEQARAAAGAQLGEVYLIGVGPGDPDLLTLRAQQLLQQADVLLYDRLVPEVILGRARRDAEKINVGKTPGSHEHTQDYINQLLVEHARRGLRVARVKGGDPFIFGRGGEELQVLRAAGIPVVVVPGVTASLGAAASAGIPLTHRGVAQAVTLVTATGANSASLNWQALAQEKHTVVFYMGAAQIGHIVAKLIEHGLPGTQPVALLERATWPDERVLKSTLAHLPAMAAAAQLRSPTLLVVGEVAALA
jgi:uroporphyrin-III C-methyltransferase/precorrin-2 dehydrogenase/sirohydrochlorin ferrochelatase